MRRTKRPATAPAPAGTSLVGLIRPPGEHLRATAQARIEALAKVGDQARADLCAEALALALAKLREVQRG